MPKMSMGLGSNCCSLFFDRVLKVFQHQNILNAFLFIVGVYSTIEKSHVLGGYLKRFTIHVFFFYLRWPFCTFAGGFFAFFGQPFPKWQSFATIKRLKNSIEVRYAAICQWIVNWISEWRPWTSIHRQPAFISLLNISRGYSYLSVGWEIVNGAVFNKNVIQDCYKQAWAPTPQLPFSFRHALIINRT